MSIEAQGKAFKPPHANFFLKGGSGKLIYIYERNATW